MNNHDINFIKTEFTKIQNYFIAQKYDKVIEKTLVLLKKDPNQVTFYNYIGLSYRQLGKNDLAEEIFKKGLKKFPNSPTIICNLAALYRILTRFEEAENYFKRGMELKNNDFNLLCNYANLKRDLNQNKEAIKMYSKAYEINKHNETLLLNLAGTYQIDADFEQSKQILREIQLNFPKNTKSDFMFSSIHSYQEKDNHRDSMIKKLGDNLPIQDKVYLYFAIAKSYSDIKDHSESSKYLIKANQSQYDLFTNYNFNDELKVFNLIKNKFMNFDFKKNTSSEKPSLIFIVGLPRSGTTLTHQIISSHSEIYGAGELPILSNIFNKKVYDEGFLKQFFKSDNFNNNQFVKDFALKVENIFKKFNDKIILDKSPLNFLWIGFIKAMFPFAKIIHCKRNLKDVSLSIYKNYFDGGSLPWSYNTETLIQFIEEYKKLMQIWDKKLGDEIYNLEYENLINNKVNETKKLIKFCNLNWEEGCIDHTKNDTGIKTVSISQARKPIYKTSININENYSKYLDFLKYI